jgi:hypothetical protein
VAAPGSDDVDRYARIKQQHLMRASKVVEPELRKTKLPRAPNSSSSFFELVKSSPFAPELARLPNVMTLPGAVAFKVNGQIVAALGVEGAPGGDKDETCAQAGIDKIVGRLPHQLC